MGNISNDFEKLKSLLDDFGIGYTVVKWMTNTCISLEAKEGNKVSGYTGFVSEYIFDENFKFVEVRVYE